MQKKSQVTLFILIGFLLLLFFVFFIFYKQTTTAHVRVTNIPNQQSLETYIENCMQQIAENALVFVPRQGGYFTTTQQSFSLGFYEIPYYYTPDKTTIPALTDIQDQLASYSLYYLPQCFDNFTAFQEQGYKIETGLPSATTVIGSDAVAFTLHYPIQLTLEDTKVSYDYFTVEVPHKLSLAYAVALAIVAAHDDATKIPLSKLTEIGEEYEVYINAGNFNTTVVYRLDIPNEETQANEKFMFAILYEWGDPLALE